MEGASSEPPKKARCRGVKISARANPHPLALIYVALRKFGFEAKNGGADGRPRPRWKIRYEAGVAGVAGAAGLGSLFGVARVKIHSIFSVWRSKQASS